MNYLIVQASEPVLFAFSKNISIRDFMEKFHYKRAEVLHAGHFLCTVNGGFKLTPAEEYCSEKFKEHHVLDIFYKNLPFSTS